MSGHEASGQMDEGVDSPLSPGEQSAPTREEYVHRSLSPVSILPREFGDAEPLIELRPTLPPRPSQPPLEKQLFNVNGVAQREKIDISSGVDGDFPPPKAFQKTHLFYGVDLGYWRMPARHFSIFLALFAVTMPPLYVVGIQLNSLSNNGRPAFQYDCYGTSNGWSFIGVNIRFGRFSYGGAKAIDLAWNWIAGRGLQAVLTLVAYRVFSDALLRAAEMTPLPFQLYASLSLYSTKPDIIWQLLKAVARRGTWRTKAIFYWLLISTIYLVVFPSLLDACSGYEVSYSALFQWPNGTLENLDDVFGAWASNANNRSIVKQRQFCASWITNSTDDPYNFTSHFWADYSYNGTSYSYYTGPEFYKYTETCDKRSWYNSSTGYHQYASSLIVYYWEDLTLNTSWWKRYEIDPLNAGDSTSWSSWDFYPTMGDHFKCIAENNSYQWGFSVEWLTVTTVINSVWLLGLWILWIDCDTNSELCRKGRRLGVWRAVVDISEAVREELGPNICAYSEPELADALAKRPPVRYYAKHGTVDEPGHIGLSSRPPSKSRFRLRWNHEYGQQTTAG